MSTFTPAGDLFRRIVEKLPEQKREEKAPQRK